MICWEACISIAYYAVIGAVAFFIMSTFLCPIGLFVRQEIHRERRDRAEMTMFGWAEKGGGGGQIRRIWDVDSINDE